MAPQNKKKKTHRVLNKRRIKIHDKDSGYSKKIVLKTVEMPDGMTEDFFVDEDKDSVQIFALTKGDKQVICVRQFRPGPEEVILELPGGGLEPGEDPQEAALRELREETSYGSREKPVFLASPTYSPYSLGKRHMYMILGCEKVSGDLDLDPGEFVEPVLFSLREFMEEWVHTGKVRGYEGVFLGMAKLAGS